MKVDPETKKIALSLRRAQPQEWDVLVGQYSVGQLVIGKATKLVPFGAFAQIEGQLEGLVHVSEISDRKIGHPNEVLREGDILPLKIVRIERDRHRLALSLKQARSDAEVRGFVFDSNGAVSLVPESEQERLQAHGIATPPWQRGLGGDESEADGEQPAPEPDEEEAPEPAAEAETDEETEAEAPEEAPAADGEELPAATANEPEEQPVAADAEETEPEPAEA